MKVFLVRHAKAKGHDEKWPMTETPLGQVGIRQAQILSKLPRFQVVDVILSSGWKRADQTAEIISKAIGKSVKTLDYIHEKRQHSKIYGKKRSSKISKQYYHKARKNRNNLSWKFTDDDESLREVWERAKALKKVLITDYKEKNILIVSHDIFIRSFVTLCLLGNDIDDKVYLRVLSSLRQVNTGVSLLSYYDERRVWRLTYFNDFSHLKFLKKKEK